MGFSSKKSYSISISIPSQNDCKKLTVSEHELIYNIKQKIIKEYDTSDGFNNFNNNGLLIVSKKKDIRRFLDEKDEIGDLRRFASDYRLEFIPKCRISSKEEERKNSSVNNTDMQKRFIEIIKSNNESQVADILDLGVDPNFLSENGETPMSLCIFNNKVNLINLLLDNGAYIDYKIPNRGKWISYLQYAIICQSFESFKSCTN
ncbi:hypothetical protein LY90DRAFT_518486 [Neocallimastix californiae]|uniref:Uncharacterized protein n=1 Tax=Neocallimastix californiae TaxID=1754190 RepID=A0A1Y1ZMW4_9FUNG|nr:hypothetical protein LY90DRAFT_518486 [Neocallimastix californiae]|eukprot:ORY11576.1 hypothetical protein LY90DRAFT_518486 [Neocallimastix californiae]